MSNTFLTPSVIAKEALANLYANTVFARLVHRDYEPEFASKVGDTVTIRKPAVFAAAEFTSTISAQNITETSTSVTLDKHLDVSAEVTAKQLTLSIQDFSAQVIQPAMMALAQKIDQLVAGRFVDVANYQDVSSTPAITDLSALDKILNKAKVPAFERRMVVGPETKNAYITLSGIVDASQAASAEALRSASLGRIFGFDTYMSQNIAAFTKGTLGSAKVKTGVDAGAAAGTFYNTTLTGTLKVGDLFTVANDSTQYVVTKAATAGSNEIAVEFYPAAKVAWAGDAVVTQHASSTENNLAFHKTAFALVSRPLALPMGSKNAAIANYEGFGIRVVYDYDITYKKDVMSFDILVGTKTLDPERAVRLIKA